MGMTDDFESSLQVLRGFDTDITVEVNEIKPNLLTLRQCFGRNGIIHSIEMKKNVCFVEQNGMDRNDSFH